MNQQFYDAMEESPVIAAVKDFERIRKNAVGLRRSELFLFSLEMYAILMRL